MGGVHAHRFTPTGVGTIETITLIPNALAVHPHGRGDNAFFLRVNAVLFGSPPRAWGQFFVLRRQTTTRRFTPTGVGTISPARSGRGSDTVHPHGRGDNLDERAPADRFAGSPPRAWGQSGGAGDQGAQRRFTPTGVGTMRSGDGVRNRSAVHPHGRGDNSPQPAPTRAPRGSPPRAWGQCIYANAWNVHRTVHPHGRGDNGCLSLNLRLRRWFTPTGVGTIRSCMYLSSRLAGSPPRAWGQ